MKPKAPEVLTFGCRLNISESEEMQRNVEAAGLGDAVIVNTCAVTAEAERQARQAIRRAKRENPAARIIVTGCASQIDPQKYAAMSEVDFVIPNDKKLQAESFNKLIHSSSFRRTPESILSAAALKPSLAEMQRAFVQVQNGCDNKCTFCIIPYGRGASRSLPASAIIAKTREYVEAGFNEVVLTGVDIASYGRDLPDSPSLGSIAASVLRSLPDLKRLRLSSLDPAAIDEDLWRLIAEEPRLMPHLHLSLQSGDDMILKRMKRRHSRDDVLLLCERARKARPDIVFGADLIAGFPTETDEMFQNTCDLIERCGITWLHVFPYSARKGTPAARMPQVPSDMRKQRAEILRSIGEKATLAHHKSLIGKTVQVLVENNGVCCTPHFAKLRLSGSARVGSVVNVKCTELDGDVVVATV